MLPRWSVAAAPAPTALHDTMHARRTVRYLPGMHQHRLWDRRAIGRRSDGTARRRWRAVALLAVAAFASGACGSSGREPNAKGEADSASAPGGGVAGGTSRAVGIPTGVGVPTCPMEGDWTPCAVEERLLRAGVVVEKQDEPARSPFFSVPGVRYSVGNPEHELLVFLYPSVAAREHDTAALDSATASPHGERFAWRTPPTLVVSNNLAAVILSLNDRTVERLALALSAGLPRPEKP